MNILHGWLGDESIHNGRAGMESDDKSENPIHGCVNGEERGE